jgi:hypothetical protein
MASAIYLQRGAQLTIKSSGGTAVITPTSVGNGAGRISARLDLGAFPHADLLEIICILKTVSTPTTGTVARVYCIGSDAATGQGSTAYTDGYFAESDAAITDEDTLRNTDLLTSVQADEQTVFQKRAIYAPTRRYLQIAFWNAYGVAMSGTAADCLFLVTPLYYENQ